MATTWLFVTIVPSAAVQRGAKGTFLYVVKDDQTVSVRPVGAGTAQGDDLSIDSGLSPGEIVVVDGTEKLREGSKVEVRNQKGAPGKPADAPSGAPPAGTEKPKRGATS